MCVRGHACKASAICVRLCGREAERRRACAEPAARGAGVAAARRRAGARFGGGAVRARRACAGHGKARHPSGHRMST